MNEPLSLGDILRGHCAKLVVPYAPRAAVDPTRLGIPRQRLDPLTRRSVLARDGYRCVWCGVSYLRNRGVLFEVDHIIPWIAGGSDHPVNLRTLCQECNQERSNRVSQFDVPALPIVWRCYSCDQWGDVEMVGPALIAAFCTTCRRVWQSVPYVADLMVGGEVPTVGVPAPRDGDQDFTRIPVTVRPPERRFRDLREKDDRRRAAAARATARAEARAELDAIRPPVPSAIFCAAEDEISGALCARIDCDGFHSSDGLDAWTEPNDDENGSR